MQNSMTYTKEWLFLRQGIQEETTKYRIRKFALEWLIAKSQQRLTKHSVAYKSCVSPMLAQAQTA